MNLTQNLLSDSTEANVPFEIDE